MQLTDFIQYPFVLGLRVRRENSLRKKLWLVLSFEEGQAARFVGVYFFVIYEGNDAWVWLVVDEAQPLHHLLLF